MTTIKDPVAPAPSAKAAISQERQIAFYDLRQLSPTLALGPGYLLWCVLSHNLSSAGRVIFLAYKTRYRKSMKPASKTSYQIFVSH
jgi:hypothetical protein